MVDQVQAAGISALPLENDWPGWFAKINLFAPRPDVKGPWLYFDLDTIIVGSLDEIALGHQFTMCKDFLNGSEFNSSMMAWDYDLSQIYHAFAANPQNAMRMYQVRGRWGDQDFINHNSPVRPDTWQRKYPGAVVSYKVNVRPAVVAPKGARVVCYHGKPRPWDTPLWKRT